MKKFMKILIVIAGIGVILFGATAVTFILSSIPTKGPRIGNTDNPRKALLVIDVQEDYTGTTSRPPIQFKNPERLIETVNRVVEEARRKDMLVIYIRQEYQGFWAQTIAKILLGGRARRSTGAWPSCRTTSSRNPSATRFPIRS